MSDSPGHHILIIDSNEATGRHIKAVLDAQGYATALETVSKNGLELLEQEGGEPFALVISSLAMPKMRGDEILKKARAVSPSTQRMLMVDFSEIETIVSAVNTADIHSCLPIPFDDELLISYVGRCCLEFDRNRKREQLKEVTNAQNKQMYSLAKHFKRKDDEFAQQIRDKKKVIRLLQSEIEASGGAGAREPLLLQDYLARMGTEKTPAGYFQEFKRLGAKVKVIVEETVKTLGLDTGKVLPDTTGAENSSEHYGTLIHAVLSEALASGQQAGKPMPAGNRGMDGQSCLELSYSEDRIQAFLTLNYVPDTPLGISDILGFLTDNEVRFGIIDDLLISGWLSSAVPGDKPLVIAQGVRPVEPKDASVTYHFPTDFQQAGKVLPDGSIDFRDRGDIPFVPKDTLLAEKTALVRGIPGTDVFGFSIEVPEPNDIMFAAGTGTRYSEDQLKVFADTGGQPFLDVMGNISVFAELNIKGDVDFNTGNINFDGNVIVEGIVKEGFKVRCASLTAAQVEGAEIDITGDLNVESGIIDAHLINVQGTVQAKFVNNSTIKAFGDLIIQKEIIDSHIFISGACMNATGSIIASNVTAKNGIQAGQIGTEISSASRLKVGVDEYVNGLVSAIDRAIGENTDRIGGLKNEIAALEAEDQKLNEIISENAYVQDRSQVELRDIEKQMASLQNSGNAAEVSRLTATVRQLKKRAAVAQERLDETFERQDRIVLETDGKKREIAVLEKRNSDRTEEKKALKALSYKTPSTPVVTVARKLMPGTVIESENALIKIKEESSRCRVHEIRHGSDDDGSPSYYTMEIAPL